MTTTRSPAEVLVLHAVRLLGFADTAAIARRFAVDLTLADRVLRQADQDGWVQHAAFAGVTGWSLTDRGRGENERQLSAELAAHDGAREVVRTLYDGFLPLNARLLRAVTDWQLRPDHLGRLSSNDHADPDWDDAVLDELAAIGRDLSPLAAELASLLLRFDGYAARYAGALTRAWRGEPAWVDRSDVDSCHRVWFELHEDFVATLGIDRGTEP